MQERPLSNVLRAARSARGWSQAALAERAGLSRSGISAIEQGRLVPSTSAALALAQVLELRVEELFSLGEALAGREPSWAWPAASGREEHWRGEVAGRPWLYPLEPTLVGLLPHDHGRVEAPATVVLAGCDPAAGILSAALGARGQGRLLALPRSSRRALELLHEGRVHLAGVHLGDNEVAVHDLLGSGYALIRSASWQAGVALAPGLALGSVGAALRAKLSWIGREEGSGARRLLDRLFAEAPGRRRRAPRRTASSHQGVAEAIRCGWAQAGVCIRLVAEQAGLDFLVLESEVLELCTRIEWLDDPSVRAVLEVLRSAEFQEQVSDLPGYDARGAGEVRTVA